MRALRKARGSQLLASASVMRSTGPPSRKAGHVGSLSGHAAQITARMTLSWSSGAAHPPGGTSQFTPSLRRSTASKGRFLIPLVVPEQAQLSHPYTFTTRGRASLTRGSGTVSQSRSQGRAPSASRAGSPCSPCACGTGRALPPRRRGSGHLRRLRPRRGGGWLVLGSGGLGGDEVSGVGVDGVEVGVVVVVVVGVVRRHLLDAGGDAPHRLHVRLWGRPAPRPPPFAPPSPRGSHAPSCLSPGAHGALALALGSLPGPHAFVPLSVPWVPLPVTRGLACTAGARALPVPVPMPLAAPTLADRAPIHSMHCVAACLGALLAPLCVLPVPLPLPGSLSRVAPSAARALSPSAAAGLGALPAISPSLLAACALACPLRVPLGTPAVASCPPLRAPVAGTLPRLCAVRPLPDHAPGVLLPPQLRQRDARRRTLGHRGADVPRPPCGEGGPGGVQLWGAGMGVAGIGVGAVLGALPALRCGCGGPPSPRGVRPPRPQCAGGRGVAGWCGGAARRSRGLGPLRTLPAQVCGCGGSRRGARGPRWGHPPHWRRAGGRGRGRGAACWGCGLIPLCAWGPILGRVAGLAAWAARAVSSAGAAPRVDGPVSAEAVQGCPAGSPTGTAASASRRSSRSARVSPAYPGETGERDRDQRWWRSSRWGKPSESDITVILVGMRGGRCALPTTSRCICVVPWAVLCSAPQGEGGRGWGAGGGVSPVRAGAGGHP